MMWRYKSECHSHVHKCLGQTNVSSVQNRSPHTAARTGWGTSQPVQGANWTRLYLAQAILGSDTLWCHVVRCSNAYITGNARDISYQLAGNAKVDELKDTSEEDKVCRLQVTMHDTLGMDDLYTVNHLLPENVNIVWQILMLSRHKRSKIVLPTFHDHVYV